MGDYVAWLLEVSLKGDLEDLKTLMQEMIDSTQGEAGTLVYEWSFDAGGGTIHIYEHFRDSAGAVAHLATFGEKFADRFLALLSPAHLWVYGKPDDGAKQALSGLGPVYMSALGGFARR
jgi:quinol monooxygenase YgiN